MDTWNTTFRLDLPKAGATAAGRADEAAATATAAAEETMLMPGEQTTARFTLQTEMPILEGQKFTLRENQSTVATGVVTKTLDSIKILRKERLDKVVVDVV